MIKIDIFSGFLGAGKTTLIKKLIKEAYTGEKVVLIENEFGQIGVDGNFLKEAGIEITEMNSGCICCSLVGDFAKALKEVASRFHPDRILIEPSGVGKLSDVIRAVQRAEVQDASLNAFCTVVDAKKCKLYLKNFGEFFLDQVQNASCILLSHTSDPAKVQEALALLKEHTQAAVVTTDWDKLPGYKILEVMESKNTLKSELERLAKEAEKMRRHLDGEECDDPDCECHHHHHGDECCHEHDHEDGCHEHHHGDECCHDHDHEDECCHEHHHDKECCHDHEDGCHEHHHGDECCHEHDHEDECCHEHHHDKECCHEHDHEDECHEHHHDKECCHDHDHEKEGCHEHHHADEVFTSWGVETAKRFTEDELRTALKALDSGKYGQILRAKGIVDGGEEWYYFDYVPEEIEIRTGSPIVTGRLCVIGCDLDETKCKELFLN